MNIPFLSFDYWTLRSYKSQQKAVFTEWEKLKKLGEKELAALSNKLRERVKKDPKSINKELPLAFALVSESIFRIKKLTVYPVQILGAIALHFGNVAEMKTGEGKTLTALLPAFLNSCLGTVYIVTVNEYLVERDWKDNKPIFDLLGVKIGRVLSKMSPGEKEESYNTEIIYITNSEIGFDYLRDNMLGFKTPKLQKSFHFAIVDEADSILIDEARTPLVISGDPINRAHLHLRIDEFILSLKKTDYSVELEHRRCFLSEYGVKKACAFFEIDNFYGRENSEVYHHLNNSLFAHFILRKNVDYLVRNKKIMLIDHFTGRVLENRSFSDGLHQALEAKERTNISNETSVLATITYQNFFRLFDKLAGITGTAVSVKNEFIATYNMQVVQIPTNMPLIRKDQDDLFFYNKKAKYLAIVAEIKRLFERGQPVLVGSNSVSTSEDISHILKNMKIPHKVLSAKHHIYEAQVVAQAGFFKSVTIATNMAGRGTDIKLDEKAKAHGGLVMLGAEKNESKRIDLQLRGRSGRQGEPGRTQFFVSLDDDIFTRFGNESFKKRFANFKFETIHSKLLNWGVNKFQKKLTQSSYEQRKTLLEYDNVISQQRQIIYHQRDFFRADKDFSPYIIDFLAFFIRVRLDRIVKNKFSINAREKSQIQDFIAPFKFDIESLKEGDGNNLTQEIVESELNEKIKLLLTRALEKFSKEIQNSFRSSLTTVIDRTWRDILTELLRYKSSSFLQSCVQKRPLEYFINQASTLFNDFKIRVVEKLGSRILSQLAQIPEK